MIESFVPRHAVQASPSAAAFGYTEPTPDHTFEAPVLPFDFSLYDGHLFYKGIDLIALANSATAGDDHVDAEAPLYVRHLPSLRANVRRVRDWFDAAAARTHYPGTMMLAYASKANPSAPVVRTLLQAGTAYECSSAYDIQVMREAFANGWIDHNRPIIINGFKVPAYIRAVLELRADGFDQILPIFDDLDEIGPFANSGLPFDVGLRFRTDPHGEELTRFGMADSDLADAADLIAHSDTLRLTTFHAMQSIPVKRGNSHYWASVAGSVRAFARLRRIAPTLHRFDIGGGMPGRNGTINHADWLSRLLQIMVTVCDQEAVPVPDLIIESGRYLVQDHAFKLFRVLKRKVAADGVPYYLLNGSLMNAFPDAWALGEKFTVLPLNGWDRPFDAARLMGLTCDHDDIYPTNRMGPTPLYLPDVYNVPANSDSLLIGFFDCGAYQETLGGRGGAKHCMLPEGTELILDIDESGEIVIHEARTGQDAMTVLGNLGYGVLS